MHSAGRRHEHARAIEARAVLVRCADERVTWVA
jgi:hypothetical protein